MSRGSATRTGAWATSASAMIMILLALLGCNLLGCNTDSATDSTSPKQSEAAPTDPTRAQQTKPSLEETPARDLFKFNCALCHGDDGRGDTVVGRVMRPRPRDFQIGAFRLISTDNGRPSRDDIIRTIRSGMPGTDMPAWPQFSDRETLRLAEYVLSIRKSTLIFSAKKRGKSNAEAQAWANRRSKEGDAIAVPTEPAKSNADAEQRKELFLKMCAPCHGGDGKGKRDPAWRTEEGFPISSRNFRDGIFKGGGSGQQLYLRIAAGMPGTPMPGFGLLAPKQIWDLVHFIQSLSPIASPPLSARP